MWENINGEFIWIDKEMGWEENERYNSVGNDKVCSCGDVRGHGRRLTAGGVAVGVAGGMIGAKVVSKVWGFTCFILCAALVLIIMF
jgi:hypothetical protein